METIIGLLFILLPVIFKFIEKKLQESGNTAQAGKVRELAELFETQEDDAFEDHESEADSQPVVEFPAAPVLPKPVLEGTRMERVAPAKVKAPVSKPSGKMTPILMEEPEKKKEKIDPKKLVIYSEIMKPKYQD